jgi:hypothetical protein
VRGHRKETGTQLAHFFFGLEGAVDLLRSQLFLGDIANDSGKKFDLAGQAVVPQDSLHNRDAIAIRQLKLNLTMPLTSISQFWNDLTVYSL